MIAYLVGSSACWPVSDGGGSHRVFKFGLQNKGDGLITNMILQYDMWALESRRFSKYMYIFIYINCMGWDSND